MNKIAIIGIHNLHMMQFLYKYTAVLDKNDIAYDVIYWDRDMDDSIKYTEFKGKKIRFAYEMSNYQPKYKKIIGFAKCFQYVLRILKKEKYDHIVLLTTQTAFPLYILNHQIRKAKYIFDYRDITYEANPIAKKIIQKIIKRSYRTAISSKGFIQIIGDSEKYLVAHNVSELKNEFVPKIKKKPIRIVYWGMVRQVEYNKRICDIFGNDYRFELIYHGEGYYKELKEYCEKKDFKNINFSGRYTTNCIKVFAEETDILLNMYENDKHQKNALTVKLYDGIRYGLPMLLTQESYMSKFIGTNSHVFSMNACENSSQEIYDWYMNLVIDRNPYSDILNKIIDEEHEFERVLLEFVK